MKNKYLKLLISIFLVFVFTTSVKAGFNPADCNTSIYEDPAKPAEFDVKARYCERDTTQDPILHPFYNYYEKWSDAYNSGTNLVDKYIQDADGKGTTLTSLPLCVTSSGENKGVVLFKATCNVRKNCNTYTTQDKCNDHSNKGCHWSNGSCNDHEFMFNSVDFNSEKYNSPKTISESQASSGYINDLCKHFYGAISCSCSEIKYYLACPSYPCKAAYKNISACTPHFTIGSENGSPVFCVNPSQGFNKICSQITSKDKCEENDNCKWNASTEKCSLASTATTSHNYQLDSSFDARQCANSYSTVECGYANILIEGAYYNRPSEGHSISDEAIDLALRLWGYHTGQQGYDKKFGLSTKYSDGGTCNKSIWYYNPEHIEYDNVYRYTHDYIMAHFYAIALKYVHIPDGQYMTGEDGDERGKLFDEIQCDSSNNDTLMGVTCGSNRTYRIAFELFFNTLIGNRYMKEHLDSLSPDGIYKPVGVNIVDGPDEEQYVEVFYEDETFWESLPIDNFNCQDLESLRTNLTEMGYSEEEINAMLDKIEKHCEISVTLVLPDGSVITSEDPSYDGWIVWCQKNVGCKVRMKEKVTCDIVSETTNHIQVKVTHYKPRDTYKINRYISCANPSENQEMYGYERIQGTPQNPTTETTTTTFKTSLLNCDGGCDHLSLSADQVDRCETGNNENMNGVYTKTVKDPGLRCILNASNPTAKLYYDYSSYFGVNTNLCRIYCSDSIKYSLADKVQSLSGRNFKYNIEFAVFGTNDKNYLISSVIEEQRTCVSEIFYHSLATDVDYKTIYGLEYEPSTFKELYLMLKNKASSENDRRENINQILYDLYNCNLFESIPNALTVPRNNVVENVHDRINDIYKSSNSYGLGSDFNGTSSGSQKASTKYEWSPLLLDGGSDHPNVSPVTTTYSLSGKLNDVKYCISTPGNGCFSYSPDGSVSDYQMPQQSYNSSKYESSWPETVFNVSVPKNDYAYFSVKTTSNIYNNNTYYMNYGDGSVLSSSDENHLQMEAYSYPVSYDAFAYCFKDGNRTEVTIDGKTYARCPVKQILNPLLFYRVASDDSYTTEIRTKNTFTCSVDVLPPETTPNPSLTSNTRYRNVDLGDLFPSNLLTKDSAWNTAEGLAAIDTIQESASSITIDPKYHNYRITLTPEQIKELREDNKNYKDYSKDIKIYGCSVDSTRGIETSCRSNLLHDSRDLITLEEFVINND